MPAQYDTIQAAYDDYRKTSVSLIECADVEEAVAPFIKDACVLDLACGTGFYSYHLLNWGAKKVVGVDISSAMIEQAQRTASSHVPPHGATIDFKVADCAIPVPYEGGPFDFIFAAWLLNYAPSGKHLVEMFRNVALNLREGGSFLAVIPVGTQDPAAFVEAENRARPSGSGGLICSVTGVVEDGISIHAHADTGSGDMDFDCYHLRKEVYEAAARKSGMSGEVAWSVTSVPDKVLEHREGGASMEELQSYKVTPHYGMLFVAK